MIYNRGRNRTRGEANNLEFNDNPEERTIEQKTFKNTKAIISKITQISYQLTSIENAVSELLEIIKKAKSDVENEENRGNK